MSAQPPAPLRQIGVYVCHCGGNISDYVDVEQVVAAVAQEPGVSIARTHMFTCSDAAQSEIILDIKEQRLDGLVIASCSPKLHLFTFRGMAERAGLNPYQYVQVNLREQDSWAHTHDRKSATAKGIALVKAGIARARHMEPLTPLRVNTKPRALVIGAGAAGLSAALALSDLGLGVDLVEKADAPGGWTREWRHLAPAGEDGAALVADVLDRVRERTNITLWLGSEVAAKQGNLGDFKITLNTPAGERTVEAGALIVATGFEPYTPQPGEFGSGLPGVLTLAEFKRRFAAGGPLRTPDGREVRSVAYIYCVGSRQKPDPAAATRVNTHCSRTCCTAACETSTWVQGLSPAIRQYHLFRDIRAYGANELVYSRARQNGALFLRYDAAQPPRVEAGPAGLVVRVTDTLTAAGELELAADLVVLVTGMQSRPNAALQSVLKVPTDQNGFLKEIHPKLRPVETVLDGIFIAGAAQSPRLVSEAVASALAAVSKCGALLKKGYVDLEPLIASVDKTRCTWCGKCQPVCPYQAIEQADCDGKPVAAILPFLCKGCGACVPLCPDDAIELKGFADAQVREAISALAGEARA